MRIRAVHNMILTGLIAIGLVCGFFYLNPNKAYANDLINSGFETDANSDNEPDSWTAWDITISERSTAQARSDSASARCWTSGADSGGGYYQSFSSSAGKVYVGSAYLRSLASDALAGGAEAFLKLEFKDSSGTIIKYYESPHLSSSNNAWERHTVVGTAPPTTATVQFNVAVWTTVTGATGSCYFDETDLHEITSIYALRNDVTNLVYNNSFEIGDGAATVRPKGWRYSETGGNVQQSNTYARSGGTQSVRIGAEATTSNSASCYKDFRVQEGQIVEVTAYCRTSSNFSSNSRAYVKFEWYNANATTAAGSDVEWSSIVSGPDSTTYWTTTPLKVVDSAPQFAFFGRLVLMVDNNGLAGTAGSYAYFDDVSVKVYEAGLSEIRVANTPEVTNSSGGWELTFDSGWGGNISSYYDNSVTWSAGSELQNMISNNYNAGSYSSMYSLFAVNYAQGAEWISPNKNKTGTLTVVEQSPTRTVVQSYAQAMKSDKTAPTGSDYWTTTYTVYPGGRMFITQRSQIGAAAVTDGPYMGLTQDYAGYQATYYYEDDPDAAAYLDPDADGHDAALWIYKTTSSDFQSTKINAGQWSAQDRMAIEAQGDYTQFTASSDKTHYYMIDLSEAAYSSTTLDNKGLDYKTHTSGTYSLDFTDGVGSLLNSTNSINTDADQDGFDEGAGCWNVKVGTSSPGTNGLRFTLQADATVTRYKPAFFITAWTDTQLPASVEVAEAVKEQGTDYNVAFVPFSKVYKRYNAAATFSTKYAEDYDGRNTSYISDQRNAEKVINSDLTDETSLTLSEAAGTTNVIDVKAFYDLGGVRDIASATAYVVYRVAAGTGTNDSYEITASKAGTFADTLVTIVSSNATTGETTASADLGTVTEEQIFRTLQFRLSVTKSQASDARTFYWKNAYIGGTYYADDITEIAAAFNTQDTTVFDNQNDYLYIGSLYKFNGILVDIFRAASATIDPAFEYYVSGTAWTALTVTDNTSGFTKDGMITFTAPSDWAVRNLDHNSRYIGGDLHQENLYYVRIKRQAVSLTTIPQIMGLATNNLILQYMSNVSSNTEFALVGATLVDLLEFDAIGYFGKVKLFWKTGSELNNIGFNIYRSEDGKNYVKVNKEIILGLGTNIMGKEYLYEDTDVVNGKTYYYLLEDVEKGGKTTRHGPVAAHPGLDFDNDGMTDDWEYYYGLPATVYDANVDSDDDGLTNIEEFAAGTNPLVIDSENTTLASQNSGVKVIESGGLRTVLELNTAAFKSTNKNVYGIIYHIITLPEYTHGQTSDIGKPQLPTKGVLLGTLNKRPVTINVLESEKETFSGYNIYPVPKAVLVEDPANPDIKRLTYEFYKDATAYSINAFYAGSLAEVDYSNYLQDQQVIKIIFYPIQFNPVSGKLEFYKRIRLEVLQEENGSAAIASTVSPKTALPLTEDNAYKIYINEDGIYRLTKSYLESMGVSLSGADPRKLKIYYQDAEIPIYVSGENDGEFDASDYIEFYAQAADTRYTGTNVYWLVSSDSTGLRMATSTQDEAATTTLGSFLETYRKEDNVLYWMEAKGADHWFIDAIYGSQIYDLTLNLDGVANTTSDATLKIAVEGSIYSGITFGHHLYARLNGYPIADVTWSGNSKYIIESKISQTYLNEGANTVTLEVADDSTGYEEILINWVEVSYWRKFIAKENVLKFGTYASGAYLYSISGLTNQNVKVYDITEPKSVERITQLTVTPEGSAFAASFKDIGSKKYVVLTEDKAKVPAGLIGDEPSNLADKVNRADYIIITHPDFYDTMLSFADYRSKQGLKVKVVKLDDIYDEFNYGIADVSAIKDFLKFAYYNWTGPRPTYVLLVGDATYDYRDYSGYGFTNYVPTYLVHSLTFGETGSDNWFVCFDGESDVIADMLIGRFPVKTTAELKVMIDKIIRYESVSPDTEWTKKVLLVADDDETIFGNTAEKLASYLTKGYMADKQYLGTTTNNPSVLRWNIINSINNGRLFVNYTGHGGIGLWANERIFTWDDIKYLYNEDVLPVFTTLTCANGYFVYPRYIEGLGERLVTASGGGAIASFVPSGISYPTTQAYLADGFYGAFFGKRDAILGSLVAYAKLSVFENEPGGDAINVIQTYNLFGDPALSIRMKTPQIPAVAAPQVFNLDSGKVNDIFRLTEETQSATSASNALANVIVSAKGKDETWEKKGLTKIVHEEENVVASPSNSASPSEEKIVEAKLPDVIDILENKTDELAPPKWKALSKVNIEPLKIAKPFAKIDYGKVEEAAISINKDAQRLTELRTKFDEAVKEADFQKAKTILRQITTLARKIYWRTF